MKTLKKSLCLILSVIMVVGVLAVSASAATFTDDEKIQYTEAVEVLSAIKVIDGVGDGSFAPTATLTREQGAAIVIRALLTRAVSDNLGASGVAFSDVPASWWSAGVVNEAAARGIINGIGDGTFAPSAELTVAQFAKMLLVAIGVEGEYTGSNWYNNVVVAATKAELAEGISGVNYNAGITREEACQMAWNALQYSVNGKTVTYTVTLGDETLYKGTNEDTAALIAGLRNGKMSEIETPKGSISDVTYHLTRNTEANDAFGRSTVVVTDGKENGVKVTVGGNDPIATYTTSTKISKLAAALGATANKTVTLKVYENSGKNPDTIYATKNGEVTVDENGKITSLDGNGNIVANDETPLGGTGTLIEVYKDKNNTYRVIIIDTYVTTIGKSDIHKADEKNDKKAYITIGNMEYETEAFKANDVVLYTVADGKIQNVVKADHVSGSVTASSTANKYIKVDGVQYGIAKNNATKEITIGSTAGYKVSDTVYTYYLDNYGNVIMAKEGDTASVTENLIYVIATASKEAKAEGGSDLFNTGAVTSAAQAQAKVINMTTGAIEVVNLGIVKNTEGKYVYATKNGAAGDVPVDGNPLVTDAGVYKYATLDDGSIVLGDPMDPDEVTITKDSAKVEGVNGVATSSTVVTIVEYTKRGTEYTGASVTTMTGIANFPQGGKTYKAVVNVSDSGRITEIVVVQPKNVTNTVTYAVYKGEGEETADGIAYAFYVNGEVVEYTGGKDFDGKDTDGTSLVEKKVYNIDTANGKITKATAATVRVSEGVVEIVDDTFFTVKEGNATNLYYLTSSAVIVAEGDDYNTAELSADDKVTAYGNAKGEIEFVIINAE